MWRSEEPPPCWTRTTPAFCQTLLHSSQPEKNLLSSSLVVYSSSQLWLLTFQHKHVGGWSSCSSPSPSNSTEKHVQAAGRPQEASGG